MRRPEAIAEAIQSERPLTTDRGVIAPSQLLVEALLAQLRAVTTAIERFDEEIAERSKDLADYPLFAALPGAGAALAPRLLVALGERRERFPDAAALQKYAGVAPVTERSGNQSWVHWRFTDDDGDTERAENCAPHVRAPDQRRGCPLLLRGGLLRVRAAASDRGAGCFVLATRWGQKHWRWVRGQVFDQAEARLAVEHYVEQIDHLDARIRVLDEQVAEVAATDTFRDRVARLSCLRGISTLSAMVLLVELGDVRRFESPRQLMAYTGLVPSEHSSGESRRRGGLTKTGNCFVRRDRVMATTFNLQRR